MTLQLQELQKTGMKKMPTFKAGQSVRVFRKIQEGEKERIQMFDGLIIETSAQNSNATTITVRKIVSGVGVEQVFQVHSPLIDKIEVVKEARVRRARLYFMRGRRGKAARLRERFLSADELAALSGGNDEEIEAEKEAAIDEAVEAEAKREAEENAAPEVAEAAGEEKPE